VNNKHPWAEFLDARAKCIMYFRRNGKTDKQIANDLSMDEEQVYYIAQYQESLKNEF
jgi:hypothetical protein